jgi:alpha-D-xyloside xylohydrolase
MTRLLAVLLALVAAPAVLAAAAPAAAAEPIVVEGKGGSVRIDREPFRMHFLNAHGNPVLREVVNRARPGATAEIVDPAGFDADPEVATYQPLAFEVGGEAHPQWHMGFWSGNLLTGGRAGVIHHATKVIAQQEDRLVLATTDPTRTIALRVTPDDAAGTFRVRAELSDATGVSAFSDSFRTEAGEPFRGFGGRHNAIDQRGEDFYGWIEEEGYGAGPGQPVSEKVPGSGGDQYIAPNGKHAAYYAQSQFVSDRYGFFLNQDELTRWRMASDRDDAWQFSVSSASLDYTVAVGAPARTLRSLTAITGRQRVAPDWAMGATLKRNVQLFNNTHPTCTQSEGALAYECKIRDDIKLIKQHGIKLTSFAYEGWNIMPEATVRSINAELKALGIRPQGYVRAYLSNDGAFDRAEEVDEATSKGYVAKDPTGRPYVYFQATPSYMIDFTNPEAVKWWEKRVRRMLDLGFDGFMQDFGEQVMADMRFHNGKSGREMHNRYPVVYHAVTRRILDAYQAEHPERGPIFMYTRAGYSGRQGSTASEDGNFPGDETTDYNRGTGLPSLTPDALNRGIFGAVGFATGIGGYIDSYTDNLTGELFTRWSQWAAFSPFFRVHNSCCDTGTRMPWDFGPEVLAEWKEMAALHERALPLLRREWKRSVKTGSPIMRPLWLAAPGDAEAAKQDQQWMVGDDLLVAPVVQKEAAMRRVYFPRGCWKHGETGKRYAGGRYADVPAPITSLPYFVRCGTDPLGA